MKTENDYLILLEHDKIQVKNPHTNLPVNLYRVCAKRTFRVEPEDIKNGIGPYADEVINRWYTKLKSKYDEVKESCKIEQEKLDELKSSKEDRPDLFEQQDKVDKLEFDKRKLKARLDDFNLSAKPWPFFGILKGTVGGYVENLDIFENKPSWVGNNAMVFGKCKVFNSYIIDSAIICGDQNCQVENSLLKNSARVTNNVKLKNSIIRDAAEIRNNAVVKHTIMLNSTLIFENSIVNNSILTMGAFCRKNSKVERSILTDTSHCEENSIVTNSILSNNAVVINSNISNQTLSTKINLKSEIGK